MSAATTRGLAAKIRRAHRALLASDRESLRHAIRAGTYLREAKAKVGHGRWLLWLAQHCRFSERTAQDYVRAADYATSNPHAVADLTYTELRAQLRRPTHQAFLPYSRCRPFVALGFKNLTDRDRFYELVRGCGGRQSDPLPTVVAALERWVATVVAAAAPAATSAAGSAPAARPAPAASGGTARPGRRAKERAA